MAPRTVRISMPRISRCGCGRCWFGAGAEAHTPAFRMKTCPPQSWRGPWRKNPGPGQKSASLDPWYLVRRQAAMYRRLIAHGPSSALSRVFGCGTVSGGHSSGCGRAVRQLSPLHEVERHHVTNSHVAVFNASHMRFSDANLQLRDSAEFAAVASSVRDCMADDGIRLLRSPQDVG